MRMAMPMVVPVTVSVPKVVAMAGISMSVVLMGMRIAVVMVMAMLMFTMVVLLHGTHLTSVAQVSAFGALAANMGAHRSFPKGTGRAAASPFRTNAGPNAA